MARIVSFLLFQGVWFACVLGAARGNGWVGPAAAVGYVGFELARARERAELVRLLARAALLGWTVDCALLAAGRFGYAAPNPLAPELLVPGWIAALWLAFAAMVPGPLAWLRGRPRLAALLGAVGGPLSFLTAERMGAVSVAEPRAFGIALLALEWALLTPLVLAPVPVEERRGRVLP